jgi:hypothetical protein
VSSLTCYHPPDWMAMPCYGIHSPFKWVTASLRQPLPPHNNNRNKYECRARGVLSRNSQCKGSCACPGYATATIHADTDFYSVVLQLQMCLLMHSRLQYGYGWDQSRQLQDLYYLIVSDNLRTVVHYALGAIAR